MVAVEAARAAAAAAAAADAAFVGVVCFVGLLVRRKGLAGGEELDPVPAVCAAFPASAEGGAVDTLLARRSLSRWIWAR